MTTTAARATELHEDPTQIVRRILRDRLRGTNARILLFGSRARGTVHPASDMDIAILPRGHLPIGLLGAIRESLEESTVPFAVDLVDLSDVDRDFRERVLAEGVPWDD